MASRAPAIPVATRPTITIATIARMISPMPLFFFFFTPLLFSMKKYCSFLLQSAVSL